MPQNSPPEHIPGFKCRATPWLAVNPNYTTINAAQETADPNSVYNYTRQLIALRAKTPAFVYGDFKDLDPNHPQVFLYTRTLNRRPIARRSQFLLATNRLHPAR